ncbi:hypothetical protein [Rhizobium sp. CECT 9324]|uniref:hypothetical protein n=1 Tax=Rhizobium sp. CECT 9324 TaxID=2845820 RepID=UPI001E3CF9A4|nr:hypothetical protein [Rhizobium sp. CECT 9324]CAH0339601.1 hypothetical protein RHI9324_01252 [Rhizobium sp. CECT 9324]
MSEQSGNNDITRPIVGIENRTAQEVFDIMVDRIRRTPAPSPHVLGLEAIMDDVWNAAVEQAAVIAKDCVHLTPEPDAAIRVMLNGRAKLHPASQAALATTEGQP